MDILSLKPGYGTLYKPDVEVKEHHHPWVVQGSCNVIHRLWVFGVKQAISNPHKKAILVIEER